MIGRTLHFGNPAHLSLKMDQLVIELKDSDAGSRTVPIEDIGMIVLEHPHITLTTALLAHLMHHKVAVIGCDNKYMPCGLFLPLEGHSEQTERMHVQLNSSKPLRKQLWQQTVKAKILNQALLLRKLELDDARLLKLHDQVKSGDPANCEGQAASHYWSRIYGANFTRGRERSTPNAQLNYGYAILRSVVARAITASGMLPSIGIHHRNKYNAFCLADDIMEPYRPFVDQLVIQLLNECNSDPMDELSRDQKIALLKIPQLDILIEDVKRPLFHAVSMSTASLYKCFEGSRRKIAYPVLSS